ncbi:MAG: Ig-like domain-containing protein [Flavobacterium sp.]|nr:Ig-like domain-containing protein [Pedobacter sp.]
MNVFRNAFFVLLLLTTSCKRSSEDVIPSTQAGPVFLTATVDGVVKAGNVFSGVALNPEIRFSFSKPVSSENLKSFIKFSSNTNAALPFTAVIENATFLVVKPLSSLNPFTSFTINISNIQSPQGGTLKFPAIVKLTTGFNPVDKFPIVTDDQLLDIVQKQTFKYFWDFGHPVSGLSRERETSGDLVTSGGSGFGIMSIIVGIHRQFVTRADGLARIQKIVGFLQNNTQKFHGAYPHWLNGATGESIPFGQKDDGADLVETAYLIQGLLTARQYFNGADADETALRNNINVLWNAVEWNWFRKNGEDVLYWHWSPQYNWEINLQVSGWNEALITYVLAASSNTSAISRSVYDTGWARNGAMKNGEIYFGEQLPLGPAQGGPLFFAHYSFLGINPTGLSDAYANYEIQNLAHALINYNYCKANPKGYAGYSENCWGLTSSDDIIGYRVHDPANDNGVISPTAALSSFPYTPDKSMAALKFFYYKLGDRIFKEYGFTDAFSMSEPWFAQSFLAIDQGPIIIMIENHRSGLLWNLFMSCPEVKAGMKNLGFQSPNL